MAQNTALNAPAQAHPLAAPQPMLWRRIYQYRWAYLFISPFYILFALFGLYPVVYSFYLSFHDWNGLRPMRYVGLENYEFLFGRGGQVFWQSMQNGVILFLMYVPVMTLLALVLAVILNSPKVRGFSFYRTLIFAPYVTSMIAAGFVFRILLDQNGGIFNQILGVVGISPIPWLDSVWGSRVSLSLLVIWGGLGYNMVLMLAGLQMIPRDLLESAAIDGANRVQAFLHITVPLMRPIITFVVILSSIGAFSLFNEVVALGGGTQRSLNTPLLTIYGTAFNDFRFGRASAMAYVYFIIIMVLTYVQFRYFNREEKV